MNFKESPSGNRISNYIFFNMEPTILLHRGPHDVQKLSLFSLLVRTLWNQMTNIHLSSLQQKHIVGLHIWEEYQGEVTKIEGETVKFKTSKTEPQHSKPPAITLSHWCFFCLLTSFFPIADRFSPCGRICGYWHSHFSSLHRKQNIISLVSISISEKEKYKPRIRQFSLLWNKCYFQIYQYYNRDKPES